MEADQNGFPVLLKMHIRVLAAQRNLLDLQLTASQFVAQFLAEKRKHEAATGLVYNEETLEMEARKQ